MPNRTSVLERRFITLAEVRKVLAISSAQAYSLVRSGELRAIRVGGRGQWRIDIDELEAYIKRAYYRPSAVVTADLGASSEIERREIEPSRTPQLCESLSRPSERPLETGGTVLCARP